MGSMFGTDGVRGVANRDLTPDLAFKLGRAGAFILARDNANTRIVIGRDTRISGDMLEAALVAGICSAGVDVLKVGIMPTPAIAYLTRELKAAAGIVISASHNPVEDNGIKFFGASGYKLSDEAEAEIEALVLDDCSGVPCPVGAGVGRAYPVRDAAERYINYACSTVNTDFKGLKIMVDCANGAAYHIAPRIYEKLGAEVIPLFNCPDGVNINNCCGSTHPETLMEAVSAGGADLGLAHDGDSDRVLAVDAAGRLVDGDQIMVICAKHLKEKGLLEKDTVVVTVMSNLGLHLSLRAAQIKVIETKVGDRYVLEELLRTGARLGGEQSGHIIFWTTTPPVTDYYRTAAACHNEGKRTTPGKSGKPDGAPAPIAENVRVADKNAVMDSPLRPGPSTGKKNAQRQRAHPRPAVRHRASGEGNGRGKNMEQLKAIIGRLSNIIKEIENK